MAGRQKGAKNLTTSKGLRQYQAAEILGVTTATVSVMARSGELRTLKDGFIDPQDPKILAAQGIEVQEKRGRGRPKGATNKPEMIDLGHERARRERAHADKAELELQALRGELVNRKEVEDTAMATYIQVSEALEDAVETCAQLIASRFSIPEPEVRSILEAQIYEAREKLADEIETRAG